MGLIADHSRECSQGDGRHEVHRHPEAAAWHITVCHTQEKDGSLSLSLESSGPVQQTASGEEANDGADLHGDTEIGYNPVLLLYKKTEPSVSKVRVTQKNSQESKGGQFR